MNTQTTLTGTVCVYREHQGRNVLSADFISDDKLTTLMWDKAPKCFVDLFKARIGTGNTFRVEFCARPDGSYPRNAKSI